ncbi:MAG: TRAP transporter small permease [Synergistaceae bacterium]|nr:TRAP transporter small permease [Synergistaceae bacterium]
MHVVRKIFSLLGGVSLAGVFVIVFAQVIQRYVFQLSMPWANDVIQILFTYSVFLGMAVGIFNKSHLNVDVLVQCFSPKGKQMFALLTNVIVIVFLSAVFFYSVRFVTDNMDQYMTYVKVPMSLSYAAIPLTVFFMLIQLLLDLVRQVKNMGSSEDSDLQREGR